MMRAIMSFFHIPITAVSGIIAGIHYVAFTMQKDIKVIGKLVRYAEILLKRRCMCIMALMNITLKY